VRVPSCERSGAPGAEPGAEDSVDPARVGLRRAWIQRHVALHLNTLSLRWSTDVGTKGFGYFQTVLTGTRTTSAEIAEL